MTESWPWKFRADVQRYSPQGQTILPASNGLPLTPPSSESFLLPAPLWSQIASSSCFLRAMHLLLISGSIITYFPIARLADFHVGHHDRFGFLALQVHAAHGGEKLEIMFPPSCEQAVLRGMEQVLVPTNSDI